MLVQSVTNTQMGVAAVRHDYTNQTVRARLPHRCSTVTRMMKTEVLQMLRRDAVAQKEMAAMLQHAKEPS